MTERFKPSVTVAAVIERDGRYLLVEEQTSEGLLLNNPAGHLEQGESPVEGVIREVLEETARDFTATAWLGMYMSRFLRPARGQDVTYVRVAFVGDVGEQIPGRAFDAPIQRTLWMTLEEVRACRDRHRSPLVLQCIEDHAAGRRLPLDALYTHPSLYEPPVHH
ncbi:ADP-ribose pyrophosphatase YjhB, NUDIX family [Roseateles sp. YR242]|uniref:NUDIX hydrolase n=1 Tax=Roseateles sp. YR242 TaxID=1855305 RepID=UPI0008D54AC8|nr:NUDIX hydrolase [Roseateles sp. YR242]SEL29043.1 ADP-ribose pyrophosphatase YjhB, NUDIX family [Roseateles sp. YR242]